MSKVLEKEPLDFYDVEEDDIINDILLPENCKFTPTIETPNIQSLCIDWKEGTLVIPKFQRGFVWEIKQASKFIESLLLGLPIPNLFFYLDKNEKQYIIDGQQRLKTILYFLGEISKDSISEREYKFIKFKLQGLSPQSKWYDCTFDDLDEIDKRKLTHKTLNVTKIHLGDNDSLKGIYHIFERLNTGGTPLSEQEIRNCVYSGKFNDFLLELNENPTWRKFITVSTEKSHQKDVELILRFFALYDGYLYYKKPMKTFLSNYMHQAKLKPYTNEELSNKRILFENVVNAIYNCFGEKPFHIRNQINSAVCDSVMVGFARNLNNIPDDIAERYYNLTQQDEEYYSYVSKSSNDNNSVCNRIQMVERYLFPPKEFESPNTENKNKIKLFSSPVCAGSGFYIDDTSEYIDFFTDEIKADYAVKVKGDSMSPKMKEGDILLVQKTTKPKSGDIVIVTYYNETMCKKIIFSEKCIYLHPINIKHKKINVTHDTMPEFRCDGKVIGVIDKDTII